MVASRGRVFLLKKSARSYFHKLLLNIPNISWKSSWYDLQFWYSQCHVYTFYFLLFLNFTFSHFSTNIYFIVPRLHFPWSCVSLFFRECLPIPLLGSKRTCFGTFLTQGRYWTSLFVIKDTYKLLNLVYIMDILLY